MSRSLYDRLIAAQKRMYKLQEKFELLKEGELKEWETKIHIATENELPDVAEEFHQWELRTGYPKLHESLVRAREEYSEARKAYDDMMERRNIRDEKRRIKESGLTEDEWREKQAVKEYGYTTDWNDAGYLLKNGKLLNFSGEKGKHYGTRGMDHRNIGAIYASMKCSGFDAMIAFMNGGNIRVMFESPGIDLIAEPTAKQFSAIREMARASKNRNCFYVDFTNDKGKVIGNLSYEGVLYPERIINDIKTYFATGKLPETKREPCFA